MKLLNGFRFPALIFKLPLVATLIAFVITINANCNRANSSESDNSSKIDIISVRESSYKKSIPYPFIGFNTNTIKGPKWTDPKLLEVLKTFQPQLLRYPGGTVSSLWDWEKGWFIDNMPAAAQKRYGKFPKITATLEEFKSAVDATAAIPVFVLNMLTSNLNSQLEMLIHAKESGMQIRRVELGNEYYQSQSIFEERFPEVEVYFKEAVKWANAIKKEFPDAKIGVIATRNGYDNDSRSERWNQQLFELVRKEKNIDAVTVHPYSGPGRGIKELKNEADESDISNILGASFNALKLIDFELGNEKSIWVSEYNVFDTKKNIVNSTWLHALYVANMTLNLLEKPNVEMILYHSLIGHQSFRAIFTGENDLEKMSSELQTTPFDYTAAGYAMKIQMNIFTGKTEAVKLIFNKKVEFSSLMNTYNGLIGWKFQNESEFQYVFLNLTANTHYIQKPNNELISVNRYYSKDILSPVNNSGKIISEVQNINDTVQILPYSITILQ